MAADANGGPCERLGEGDGGAAAVNGAGRRGLSEGDWSLEPGDVSAAPL